MLLLDVGETRVRWAEKEIDSCYRYQCVGWPNGNGMPTVVGLWSRDRMLGDPR